MTRQHVKKQVHILQIRRGKLVKEINPKIYLVILKISLYQLR